MANVYRTPEYLRNLNVVPYDHEGELAAERWRQEQASYAYRQFLEHERRHAVKKNVLAFLALSVLMAIIIVGACLL